MLATLGIAWQAIKLLGIWKRIGGALSYLCIHPATAIAIVLALAAAYERHGWSKAERVLHSTEAALAVCQADKAHILAAEKQAAANQIAANKAVEQKYKDKADDADNDNAAALVDARDAADRYIASHRVRASDASRGSPSGTDRGAQGSGAQGSDGPGAASVMVTPDDIGICTENTTRLDAVVRWARGLGI